jgi:uncharacterized membrane protein
MSTATTKPLQAQSRANRYGRKGGRGIRPWLLVPKIIAVAFYIGGLMAVTFIWIGGDYASLGPADPRREWLLNLVGRLMVYLVVPSLLVAIVCGVLLLLQHTRVFLRMRWLRVKLLLLLILIPAGHFWCRAQTVALRQPAATAAVQSIAARNLTLGLIGTLLGSVGVVAIGRVKPRLGQKYTPVQPPGKVIHA